MKKLGLLALSLLLSACAMTGGQNSYTAGGYPPAALEAVAGDLASQLAAAYPPGRVSLYIAPEDGQAEAMGQALESRLRLKGFTIAAKESEASVTVTYVFDRLGDGAWYSKLAASDGLLVTRVWRETKGGLVGGTPVKRGRQ